MKTNPWRISNWPHPKTIRRNILPKIKTQVEDFYANLYNHKPSTPDKEEIVNAIWKDNIKTLTPEKLVNTEKEITMNEIEFCFKKNNIAPGSSGFTGTYCKAFWSSLKYLVHKILTQYMMIMNFLNPFVLE